MPNAAPGQLTRQQLYDKIRETSKDEYILSEMKRLGFWAQDAEKPSESETVIKRRGELQRQLGDLVKKQRFSTDPEAALKALRKERMHAAREKRETTRRQKADARHQKAWDWHQKQQRKITWLGDAVSLGLGETENQLHTLKEKQLPVFTDHAAVATAMGISLNELRFLAYQRETSRVSHYQRFQIAKKTGGLRTISVPMPRLKRSQYWILDNILTRIPLHEAAHGFVAGRSILTNAQPHVGKAVVINLDLQNFFPTISYRRVKGLFHHMGYSESLASVLALLCCEPDIQEVELDGDRWFVQQGQRHLPQGAPTSPAISNLICRSLDIRLQGLATKYSFSYTRYADDLSFSGDKDARQYIKKLLWGIKSIVSAEGFGLHPDKTRIMHPGRQQEVTGLVVNDRLSLDRKTIKRFRALLHQIEQSGLEGKQWNGISEPKKLLRSILGYANFVAMVLPDKGKIFKQKTKAIQQRYATADSKPRSNVGVRKSEFRRLSAAGQPPLANWKQAEPKAAPIRENTPDELRAEKKLELAARRQARKGTRHDTDADNDDAANIRLYAIDALDRLIEELQRALSSLKSLSFLELLYMKVFGRNDLGRYLKWMDTRIAKIKILLNSTELPQILLSNPQYSLQQVNRLNAMILEMYRHWRNSSLYSLIAYAGGGLGLNQLWGWKILPAILIIFAVYQGKRALEYQGMLNKIKHWHNRMIPQLKQQIEQTASTEPVEPEQ